MHAWIGMALGDAIGGLMVAYSAWTIGRRVGFKAGWLKGWNARITYEQADLKARWDAENEATRRQAQAAHGGAGRGRGGWG